MSDFTIKCGSYCPVCRGIVLADCPHTIQQLDERPYRQDALAARDRRISELTRRIASLSSDREAIRNEALEEAANVARDFAEKAANIALEGGDRARANESMEAIATRIAQAIERL